MTRWGNYEEVITLKQDYLGTEKRRRCQWGGTKDALWPFWNCAVSETGLGKSHVFTVILAMCLLSITLCTYAKSHNWGGGGKALPRLYSTVLEQGLRRINHLKLD